MLSTRNHEEKNQASYNSNAATHNELGLNSTLYLAYRDVPLLLDRHLFNRSVKTTYRVLDFGCGAGFSTELISKMIITAGHQVEIYGIDINEQNLIFARQRVPNGNFLKVIPGEKLDSLGQFDLIICNFDFVEMKQSSMTEILKSIESLLNSSGIAIITNPAGKAYKRSNKWLTFNNDFDENMPSEMRKEKIKFAEDQPIKVQVFAANGSDTSFTFFDFFHSGAAYRNAYQEASLNLLETYKPIGKGYDEIEWRTEKQYSPYKLHVVEKAVPSKECVSIVTLS